LPVYSKHGDGCRGRCLPLALGGILGLAMSQENVEIVRAAIEAYIDGDHDAYLAATAEDVEVCPVRRPNRPPPEDPR
jgi:hypothetical protein